MNESMITGCQPDSGKPTVRDERGACGIVGYGRAKRACKAETPKQASSPPNVARAVFLPDSPIGGAGSKTSQTEGCLSFFPSIWKTEGQSRIAYFGRSQGDC